MTTGQGMGGSIENGDLSKIENEPVETESAEKVTPEEIIEELDVSIGDNQQIQEKIEESIDDTNAKLNKIREKLGLPLQEGDAPSVAIEKEILSNKSEEKSALEDERAERIYQQERQKLIEEEKKRLLQEKISGLFEEFARLSSQEMQNILKSGQPSPGKDMESKHMGKLNKESAQSLVKAFEEGIKMLPEILERIPKLLEEFDEQLTKEAEKNVDEQLEKQKKDETEKEIEEKNESETFDNKVEAEGLNGVEDSSQQNQVSAGSSPQ